MLKRRHERNVPVVAQDETDTVPVIALPEQNLNIAPPNPVIAVAPTDPVAPPDPALPVAPTNEEDEEENYMSDDQG